MNIALAADHAGYEQAVSLKPWLESQGHTVQLFTSPGLQTDDDYPDFMRSAAGSLAGGQAQRAILLGGSGQGEAIAANRYKGVRAAVFYGPAVAKKVVDAAGRTSHDPYEIVRLSRQHNDANALSIGARFISLEDMKQVIKLWLETPFSGEERHQRRINKLDEGS